MESSKYKIALIGATGAIGKEIVDYVMSNSENIVELTVVVRRKLDEWENNAKTSNSWKEILKYAILKDYNDLSCLEE